MAQHNHGNKEPSDNPSALPTASQASCDHTLKPQCAHNPLDIPVQWSKFIHPNPKPSMTKPPFQIDVHVVYSPIASMNNKWTINLHDGYPLFQVLKSEGYIPPSLHILKHDLSSLAPPNGEMQSSFSGLVFSRVPHQALNVLVNLHLERSTKSSCCVASHQALYGTLHLQSPIKKLNSASPSTFIFVTLLFILELHSLCQALPPKQTEFPKGTPA